MAESVTASVTIAAPPEEVWEVLMDPRRLDEWVTAHRKLGDDLPELPLSEGDGFSQRLGVGPAGFWVEWEIVEARRPELARWRGSGPAGSSAEITYRLSDQGDESTRFDYENDFDPPGGIAGQAAKKVVTAAAGKREARKSMERLKALFED